MALQPITFVLLLLTLLLELCWGAPISSCIADERNALLNFKKSVEDDQDRLISWKDENCCNWEHVSCDNVTDHVVRLDFSSHNFTVALPQAFASPQALKALKSLCHMHTLILRVTITSGPMHKLREIFSGCLKDSIQNLDLSDNELEDYLPNWLGELHMLKTLDLSDNKLNGTIPKSIEQLSNLVSLDLSDNELEGYLPNWLGELHMLETLDLTYNKLNGTIPKSIGQLSNLVSLDLSSNELECYLPNWLGELHMLETLDLSNNVLNGTIPKSIEQLSNLVSLDLNFNELEGYLPNWLGELHMLKTLDLSNNKLNGTIPKSIGQLSNLVILRLAYNFFEGVISEVHFASLAKLKELDLGSNNLSLNVSRDWIPPFKLNTIYMGSCKIGPKFPQWLQTQVNLTDLDLYSSGIVGTLPNWFWDLFITLDECKGTLDLSKNEITGSLPHLPLCFSDLDLSSNFFEGPLPPSFYFFNASAVRLDISNNLFSGSINPFICETSLAFIILSTNKFSGELPNCWSTYSAIEYLDFSGNNLSGNLSPTFGNLTRINSLKLANNILSGDLPSTLSNCIYLEVLDLSYNNFKGKIPIWLGESFTSLWAIALESNNFTGTLPSNLSKLVSLQILYLGNNNLYGRIPRSFGNFKAMKDMIVPDILDYHVNEHPQLFMSTHSNENLQLFTKGRKYRAILETLYLEFTMDLSCNKLSGQIPVELGNLRLLHSLNLSGNHLVGLIPDEIGLLHSLESLDLSRNGLFGNIPTSMSTMTTLDCLNLSYNNLSRKIPSGNQLQTLTNDSYIGNPKLCGFPLTQLCDSNETTNVEVSIDQETKSDWYISIAVGFILGFWIVWVTFFLKKKWKEAYFQYVDYVYDAIYVAITVNINRFKRKIGNETASG